LYLANILDELRRLHGVVVDRARAVCEALGAEMDVIQLGFLAMLGLVVVALLVHHPDVSGIAVAGHG
jgi:hypothetical protein